jgi:lipopolysaccharide/colanic/teichoic acid biosynthesis glycosyltransferase
MYRNVLKRILDIVLALLALALLLPVMLAVALWIYLEDRGPIFFTQERLGRKGRAFNFLKFRSMPVNTKNLPSAKAKELPVTGIGKIIRRTNIDELPQLINILKGDMSLVGPRPAIASQEKLLVLRHKVGADEIAPGLTGLAQVNAYDGMPENEKARWDGEYAANLSFLTDVKIVLRTFAYLTKKPPVY